MYPYVPGITKGTFGTNSQNKYPAKQPQRRQGGQGVIPSFAHHSSDGKGAAVLQRVCYGAPSIIFILFFRGFNQTKTHKFKSSLSSTKLQKILSLIIACRPNR